MARAKLDGTGFSALLGVTLLLAINQVVVVEVNKGIQPVFFAGLRSLLAVVFVALWLRVVRGDWPRLRRKDLWPGLLIGVVFAAEFLCLFMALDLTAIGRASLLFYSMPIWFALMAHWGLNQRVTLPKAIGLALAFLGTCLAILSRQSGAGGNLWGDLLAVGAALGWASTAFLSRKTSLREISPELQLFWMVLVSGPVLVLAAPLFGPLWRDPTAWHFVGLLFQASIVVAGGFAVWLWLLAQYPSAIVASFSFLTPVFALGAGAVLYAQPLTLQLGLAAVLVAAGIALINLAPAGGRDKAASPRV